MTLSAVNLSTLAGQLGLPTGTTVTFDGAPETIALSTSSLAGVPGSDVSPLLILSTGVATQVNNANTSGSQGTDLGAFGVTDDFSSLSFQIANPNSEDTFTFDFSFLSEEFPEFVGSTFNDFFSVLVEGVEVAFDRNDQPITVNNNFFDGGQPTDGTFFDGRTPTLRITAPTPTDTDSFSVQLRISDVGDGIFDSAAFVTNFGFSKKQTVFVQFDAGFLDFPSFNSGEAGFSLPGSGLSANQRAGILEDANRIYEDFLVEFVQEKPTEGEFSTVHVGGGVDDLPDYLNAPDRLLGRAEKIDFGNRDKSDVAFVLSDEMKNPIIGTPNTGLIAQVLAHEAGHIFGLLHVANDDNLMYPFAGSSRDTIGKNDEFRAETVDGQLKVDQTATQNSFDELANNLGLKDPDLVSGESFFDKFLNFFGFSLSSSLSSIHDLTAVVATEDGEVIQFENFGSVSGDATLELLAPTSGDDKLLLVGKSQEGGAFDVFISPEGLTTFSPDQLGEIELIEQLGVNSSSIGDSFSLNFAASDGSLSSIGGVETVAIGLADSGATDGNDVLVGEDAVDDEIAALAGDDSVSGLGGADMLFGNEGADTLDGGAGDDTLLGGDGDDRLIGGGNVNQIDGGDGEDVAAFGGALSEFDLEAADDSFVISGAGETATVTNVESFEFTDQTLSLAEIIALTTGPTNGPDNLTGTDGSDTIRALGGDDTVLGLSGDDLLVGGGGDDSIKGAAGEDRLRGNGGDDTLKGGGDADNIKGGGGSDNLRGNGGDDVIRAGGGNDNVKGGGGADDINGGGGADILNGGGGADTISGRGGDDTLRGNGGSDIFQFRASDRNDTILDFRQGQDMIEIVSGARSFDALRIEQDGADVLIGFGPGQVRVVTDQAGAFDESDFIF